MAQSDPQEADLPEFLRIVLHQCNLLNDEHVSLPSLRSYLTHVAAGQRLKKDDLESAIGGDCVINPYFFENGVRVVDFVLALARAAIPRPLLWKLIKEGFMSVEDLVSAQREDHEFSAKYLDNYSSVVQRRFRGVFVPVPVDAEFGGRLSGADVDTWRSQVIQVAELQRKQRELERLLHQHGTLLEVSAEKTTVLQCSVEARLQSLHSEVATGAAAIRSIVDGKERALSGRIDELASGATSEAAAVRTLVGATEAGLGARIDRLMKAGASSSCAEFFVVAIVLSLDGHILRLLHWIGVLTFGFTQVLLCTVVRGQR